jgi:hypothetical protein
MHVQHLRIGDGADSIWKSSIHKTVTSAWLYASEWADKFPMPDKERPTLSELIERSRLLKEQAMRLLGRSSHLDAAIEKAGKELERGGTEDMPEDDCQARSEGPPEAREE